ncbi:peptide ABC transporter ATP-binding protein [Anaerobacillus alkalidiazotrophicus]|uniref:Peptide ABC transporter ATP-binding protein n=1 Tax=Anaerobacillus alkalidiazotrophicus TaxID=472963 RepID=A0A1S2M2P1_9BACI|nr:ABC transporter ATP-binding protein [Anaerobacillus alkalidiazotrophicus]OIJ18187.1 peptide ABC transporter ATP-binding protein [Anaerobacillus alkalidiazotrophicus]OIJ19666.1 peptide ABC transporter ATP-binding protein [Anaerobacillus alkalidiazotrophicus]
MLLEVKDIYKSYPKESNILFKKTKIDVLSEVSFELNEGECLGIIGESGSGKSTLGKIIIGLEKPSTGNVYLEGKDIFKFKSYKEQVKMRRDLSVVFQDYTSSVNPRFTVFDIIAEPLCIISKPDKQQLIKKITTLLDKVGLSITYLHRYPHELSGGQLQRVCIARAIATNPKFIVLDEAISSLDVSIQKQILDLLIELKQEYKLSYVFITHDLTAITYICDRVMFLKDGRVVERVEEIHELSNIKHEYSKRLLNAVLDIECHNKVISI